MAKPQLNLPTQARPVNRWPTSNWFVEEKPGAEILPVFTIAIEATRPDGTVILGPDGKPIIRRVVRNVSPIRNTYSPFSSEVDQRLGICPVLSAYAVAQCFRGGGLFGT